MDWRAKLGICALVALTGCDAQPQARCEQVIAVEPHHATRVYVIYQDTEGYMRKRSLHASNRLVCGGMVVNPRDYLRTAGTKDYGPLELHDRAAQYGREHKTPLR